MKIKGREGLFRKGLYFFPIFFPHDICLEKAQQVLSDSPQETK